MINTLTLRLVFAALAAAGTGASRIAHLAPQPMAVAERKTSKEIKRDILGDKVSLPPRLKKLKTDLEWCTKNPPFATGSQRDPEGGCQDYQRENLIHGLSELVDTSLSSEPSYREAKTLLEEAVTLDVKYKGHKDIFKPQTTFNGFWRSSNDTRLTGKEITETTLNKLGAPLTKTIASLAGDLESCTNNPPHYTGSQRDPDAGCKKSTRKSLIQRIGLIVDDSAAPDNQHHQAVQLYEKAVKLDAKYRKETDL